MRAGTGGTMQVTPGGRGGSDRGGRLFVVADEPFVGRGITTLLEERIDLQCLYVESLDRVRRMLGARSAEIVLWVGDRFCAATAECATELRRSAPELGFLAMGYHADAEGLQQLLASNARRFGFVLRSREPEVREIVTAIEQLACGYSATLESVVLERLLRSMTEGRTPLDALTASEREVLELMAGGLRNSEIGRRLFKSEKTIEKQVSQIFMKLGLNASARPEIDRRVTAARIFIAGGSPS
ncbi:MAG: hypothetical protein QOG63_1938 [Thermoleophilaceae bacterium]|nr:hypothetical protein [Thermoleophilaceae bacterium]